MIRLLNSSVPAICVLPILSYCWVTTYFVFLFCALQLRWYRLTSVTFRSVNTAIFIIYSSWIFHTSVVLMYTNGDGDGLLQSCTGSLAKHTCFVYFPNYIASMFIKRANRKKKKLLLIKICWDNAFNSSPVKSPSRLPLAAGQCCNWMFDMYR